MLPRPFGSTHAYVRQSDNVIMRGSSGSRAEFAKDEQVQAVYLGL
jgi:hypothetical protein